MKKISILIFLVALTANLFVWREVIFGAARQSAYEVHFLDIGQGDGTLAIFPGGISVMTDAGPDRSVSAALERVLPAGKKYIDLAIVSHPQLDHFNGFNELIRTYQIGAFLMNGRDDEPPVPAWDELKRTIREKGIPLIVIGKGDRITIGSSTIDILSPGKEFIRSGELNDTGLVERIMTPSFSALLSADIGMNIEEFLLKEGANVSVDILKVGHHGSKYSSGDAFLKAVAPKIAVISVGAKNRYDHPTPEALDRLTAAGTHIFRTDQDGTVSIIGTGGRKIRVYTEIMSN